MSFTGLAISVMGCEVALNDPRKREAWAIISNNATIDHDQIISSSPAG
jgi:hypothetical protein